jgi:hypothetical protein
LYLVDANWQRKGSDLSDGLRSLLGEVIIEINDGCTELSLIGAVFTEASICGMLKHARGG